VVPDEGLTIVRRPETKGGKQEVIGHVTSCKHSPTLGETIGLCWLPAALAAQPGSTFTIRLAGGALEDAVVHHGPFYDPGGERLRA
jgi:glycine cleavage system aminomethyltransferase T